MSDQKRYAIYLMPLPESPLARAGAKWLGWDAFKGVPCGQPDYDDLSSKDIEAITTSPRHYGFHGTLKAPFRLKEGFSEPEIHEAFDGFIHLQKAQNCLNLEISKLDGFFALTPTHDGNDFSSLAGDIVRHFEPFSAPITMSEYEKRKPHLLTNSQRAYLVEWGYPYVFDEFRFHMTLSNRLSDVDLSRQVGAVLSDYFPETLLKQNDDFCIALCVEENKQPFNVLAYNSLNVPLLEGIAYVS